MESLVLFVVLAVGAIIYFLPSIIAQHRKHSQQTAITLLNLFLGWTFVGWVGALVWASIEAAHDARRCPQCAENVRVEAVKCKHCGSDLSPA